jgi:UDP-glucose 6-dehydrogenase
LRAVADAVSAVRSSDISLVCVGTPSTRNGDLDLSFVETGSPHIGNALAGGDGDHLVISAAPCFPAVRKTALSQSCLPKDLRAAVHRSRALDLEGPMLSSVLVSNDHHLSRAVDWAVSVKVHSSALFGLSFKVGTDDLRENPYVEVAEWLSARA